VRCDHCAAAMFSTPARLRERHIAGNRRSISGTDRRCDQRGSPQEKQAGPQERTIPIRFFQSGLLNQVFSIISPRNTTLFIQFESFRTFNIASWCWPSPLAQPNVFAILRDFNIPEPVTKGLPCCWPSSWFHRDRSPASTWQRRDFPAAYFFGRHCLNRRHQALISGGRPLLVLVAVTNPLQ